jgi:autotransporter-associated beta strand protein
MAPFRRLAVVTTFVATLLIATPVAAQNTFTWNATGDTAWLNQSNWSPPTNFPGTTPNGMGNNSGDTAAFGATLPAAGFVGIDMSSTGLPAQLQLGAISFSNLSGSLAIGNSTTVSGGSGTLRLNGATVSGQTDTILSNTSGSQTLTISPNVGSGDQATTLLLGLTNGIAYVNATSGSTINIFVPIIDGGNPKQITLLNTAGGSGGTLILSSGSANNTYSGGTLVQNGTLQAENTFSSTGTGNVSVAAGARLSGHGTIAPSTGNTVDVGGTIQPGDDSTIGTLTINANTSLHGGSSKYRWSATDLGIGFASTPAPGASTNGSQSRLQVSGTLNFQPAEMDVVALGSASAAFDNTMHYSWTVATGTSVNSIAAQPTFNTAGLNTGGGTFTLSSGAGSVFLTFTPAPEPATILLGCAFAAGVTVFVRRRRAPQVTSS